MSVTIRKAATDDRNRCLELLDDLNSATGGPESQRQTTGRAEVYDRLIQEKRGRIVIAEEDGTILGMASVTYNLAMRYEGEYCQLEELIVDSSARGKNIGGLLVQRTIEDARSRGCAEYGLYLVKSTEHNEPFYAKYGFESVGTEMRQKL